MLTDGADPVRARMQYPPGAPQRPPTDAELGRKVQDCLAGSGLSGSDITWDRAAQLLRSALTSS